MPTSKDDGNKVYLLNDDPTTCGRCGSRTNFEELKSGAQRHTCLCCGHAFIAAPILRYADKLEMVRQIGGVGRLEAEEGLKRAKGDVLLAVGYIKAKGSIVKLKYGPSAHDRWIQARASSFKREYLSLHPEYMHVV